MDRRMDDSYRDAWMNLKSSYLDWPCVMMEFLLKRTGYDEVGELGSSTCRSLFESMKRGKIKTIKETKGKKTGKIRKEIHISCIQ